MADQNVHYPYILQGIFLLYGLPFIIHYYGGWILVYCTAMRMYLIPAFVLVLRVLPVKTHLQYKTLCRIQSNYKSAENYPSRSKETAAKGIGSPTAENSDVDPYNNVKQVFLKPHFETFHGLLAKLNLNNYDITRKNKAEANFIEKAKNVNEDTINIQNLRDIFDVTAGRQKSYSYSRQGKLFELDIDYPNIQEVSVSVSIADRTATEPINENMIINEGILMKGVNELNGQTTVDAIPIYGARHRRDISLKNSKEDNQNGYNISDIAEISIELCPFADFCYSNATNILYENEASCCKPCYCDSNCGKRLDCCLKTLDNYEVVTSSKMECITPKISVWNESKVYIRDYFMIQECFSDTNNNCKNKAAASWGSFFPVYSRKTDKIYVNKHCAECNNDYDSIAWNVSVVCKVEFEPTVLNDLLLEVLDEGACEIFFIPPDDEGVQKFSCHRNLVNTCNITGEWGKDDPVIRKACEMVIAPVRDTHTERIIYANVFCKLCNGKLHIPFRACPVYEHHEPKQPETSFSVLLDIDVVNAARRHSIINEIDDLKEGGVCGKFQLKDPYKNECRVIMCPSGYLRTPEGCQIYSPTWYTGYGLFITLKPVSQNLLPLSAVLSLSHNEIINLLGMKGLPTDLFFLLAETSAGSQNEHYVRGFRMLVATDESPTDAISVLETVKNALEQHWGIVLNNTTFVYKASHSRRIEPEFSGSGGDGSLTFITADGAAEPTFIINKLYFCDQIELRPDEWKRINNDGELSLTGRENDTILQFLEYNIRRNQNGELRIQICLDDFKLHHNLDDISSSVRLKPSRIFWLFSLIYCFCKFRWKYRGPSL